MTLKSIKLTTGFTLVIAYAVVEEQITWNQAVYWLFSHFDANNAAIALNDLINMCCMSGYPIPDIKEYLETAEEAELVYKQRVEAGDDTSTIDPEKYLPDINKILQDGGIPQYNPSSSTSSTGTSSTSTTSGTDSTASKTADTTSTTKSSDSTTDKTTSTQEKSESTTETTQAKVEEVVEPQHVVQQPVNEVREQIVHTQAIQRPVGYGR